MVRCPVIPICTAEPSIVRFAYTPTPRVKIMTIPTEITALVESMTSLLDESGGAEALSQLKAHAAE